ncbi:MAG: GGDEF domain-containing protein [Betaproteobacteria bacterium]|uniref:GGDEF domain-containing protein n=1 Tax=Thiomonas TaxID=32012 RepID=UPI002394735E|nr:MULTISPECIES: GGDEF domain-containing protein [Thiomonas]MDE2175551.1 GGDEF domain-containing protein [Betaproteobacteria bacterium]HML82672.1 GGDEF domain-containing protein [Thiomonas arsenitoxydans]
MPTISDQARATLKRLLELKLQPTPDNYRRVFEGLQNGAALPSAEPSPESPDWGRALPRLLEQWERSQSGLTQLQKRQQLDRLVALPTPQAQWRELEQLLERWSALPARSGSQSASTPIETRDDALSRAGSEWRELWLQTLKFGVRPFCAHDTAQRLLRELMAAAENAEQAADLGTQAREVWLAIDREQTTEDAVRNGLIELARLLLDHLGDLVPQAWVGVQATAIREQLQAPLVPERIESAQNAVRDLLVRHSVLRKSEDDAHHTAKALIDLLVRKLGDYAAEGGEYNQRMEARLEQLQSSREWDEIRDLVQDVLDDSRNMQQRSGELGVHLAEAQRQAQAAQERIRSLEGELEQVSQQLQEDPLTGALNRRGLDAEFTRMQSRVVRQGQPLTLALLDLDHFKAVNDTHGHDTGDAVLKALVAQAKRLIRPSDRVARMGGEEFMLLLPDTPVQQSLVVVQRLLVAFSDQTLVQDSAGRRIPLSFSAGVAELCPDEDFPAIYQRVDAALLQAKQAGRKRVEFAVPCDGAKAGGSLPKSALRFFALRG